MSAKPQFGLQKAEYAPMVRAAANRRPDVVALGIVAALLGMLAFGAFAWTRHTDAARQLNRLGTQELAVSRAAWEIRWYDEVLTHSASRYVLSRGAVEWRERYDQYVEKLDVAIARARAGARRSAVAQLDAVDEANQRLIALERSVFELVDQDKPDVAARILAGEYGRVKARYRRGLDTFFEIQSDAYRRMILEQRATELHQRWLTGAITLLMLLVLAALGLRYRAQRRTLAQRDQERELAAAQSLLDQRLTDALGMALDDDDALETLGNVLRSELPDRPSELLLADSSRAHLHLMLRTQPDSEQPNCQVSTPYGCPAIRAGRTLEFVSNERFDACPHLRRQPTPCSAVCVPVSLDGNSVGVLHSLGPISAEIPDTDLATLELAARRTGDRIGLLRAFRRSEQQARSDGLTGLLNRRSASDGLQPLLAGEGTVSIALLDLDQFKSLNDTYGHDAGDRALRLFARILREEARPDDIVARWGGEEFLVALDGATSEQCKSMLERVQRLLAGALERGSVPVFTMSAGIVDTAFGRDLESLVALADGALYAAKHGGRNRIELVSAAPTPA
ncbi:MAG: GGDEF domain-containing protein [Gaiellales bacterium]